MDWEWSDDDRYIKIGITAILPLKIGFTSVLPLVTGSATLLSWEIGFTIISSQVISFTLGDRLHDSITMRDRLHDSITTGDKLHEISVLPLVIDYTSVEVPPCWARVWSGLVTFVDHRIIRQDVPAVRRHGLLPSIIIHFLLEHSYRRGGRGAVVIVVVVDGLVLVGLVMDRVALAMVVMGQHWPW